MKQIISAIALAALLGTASVAGFVAQPTIKARPPGSEISLKTMVPTKFGDWSELADPSAQVVNPQTQQLLNKLYSQLLTRTYVDKTGYRIMLSMAYGDDQRGGLAAHRPEVCYPAQGFKLGSVEDGTLATDFGVVEVRRLKTSLGVRNEPVTYWLTVGNEVIRTKFDKRLAEIRLGLTGQIPDGLLFRVSSIDNDDAHAFLMQQKFTAALLASVPATTRKQLSGLTERTVTASGN